MAKRDYYEVLGVSKGASANEIKKDFMFTRSHSETRCNLFTKGAPIRFGATDPFGFTPEVAKGQNVDVLPQLQKTGGGWSWKVNDNLFVIKHQIQRQLGHPLDEGSKRKKNK